MPLSWAFRLLLHHLQREHHYSSADNLAWMEVMEMLTACTVICVVKVIESPAELLQDALGKHIYKPNPVSCVHHVQFDVQ